MRVLVLDPHGDDWLWCAGIIGKHIKNGDETLYLCFSSCKKSIPEGYSYNDYHNECIDALEYAGIKKLLFLDFPVRSFNEHRQEILDLLIAHRNCYKPDIVYTPSTYDVHQDHRTLSEESVRAFSKSATIYGYDMPWNVLNATLNYYIELSKDEIDKKIKCASFFKSQLCKDNNCGSATFLRSLAVVRGNKINARYAEAYEVIVLHG